MSNGDSPDGFVFPPFVPPSASRPPAAPAPAPAAPAPEPPASTAPWDAEAFDESAATDEDLPWLELPEPRAAEPAPAPAAVAEEDAGEGVLPDWMTWDARAEAEAESELADTPPVEGLEEFDTGPAFEAVAAEEPADLSDLAELAGMEMEEEFAAPAGADAGVEQRFAPGAFEDPFAAAPSEGAAPAEAPAEPDPFTAAEIDRTEAAEPAEAAPGAFDEVAARLEEIARELRERPERLLSGGGDDPLALLVTGYVLGWSHARRG